MNSTLALSSNAHHNALAKEHGNHTHTDIDLAAADLEFDAPILRHPSFGDVHVGQDLDAADDRRLELVNLRRKEASCKTPSMR